MLPLLVAPTAPSRIESGLRDRNAAAPAAVMTTRRSETAPFDTFDLTHRLLGR
jgi:hypothetical protein